MSMSLYCSSLLLWSYTSRWLESFVFVVLIGIEKESSKRQTGLTCVNDTLLPLLLLLHSHPKLSWHTDFWEYDIHPEWLNVICGNLKSRLETIVWNRWKFSASGCIIYLHHRIGCGIIAFSRVSLSLSVLHFTQYKLAHLLLHQLYAVYKSL